MYDCSKDIAEYLKPLASNDYTISDTLSLLSLHKKILLDNNEEHVSYYVDCLLAGIPLQEAIHFVLDEIYVHKKIRSLCEKSTFRKLLKKLCKGCVFRE